MGSFVAGIVVNSIINMGRSKGLQFKDPNVGGGITYRSTEDTTIGGFSGNEVAGDVAFDADIYDGLIAGVLYQHTHREATNNQDTSESLESNGVSLYVAKRFINLVNAGISYNYVGSEHRLTRRTNLNLDRDSHGITLFTGLSDKKGKWGWATTPSFTWVQDMYDQQKDLATLVFSWSSSINYDVTKQFTIGAGASYSNLIVQDTFPGATVRDDDYFSIGPRLRYYPTNQLTISLDFDSQQEYDEYRAYTVRLGADYAF